MSHIQRANLSGILPHAEATARLRHAPQWALDCINRAREVRGLAAVCPRPRKVAPPVRHPRATARRAAPAPALKVGVAIYPGTGEIPGGVREVFERDAFDFWWRSYCKGQFQDFTLRSGGHQGAIVGTVKDGSVTLRPIDGVGIVAVWTPDMTNLRHRAAVAFIRAGQDCVSGEFHAIRATLSGGVRRVSMAIPSGVAFLRRQEPCYRGALAAILDGPEPVGVQIGALARKALTRAKGK